MTSTSPSSAMNASCAASRRFGEQPAVVGRGAHAALAQRVGERLGALLGRRVDDARRVVASATQSSSARVLRRASATCSTPSQMFGRSKPRMTTSGSRRRRSSRISARTGGAAVAVSASRTGSPERLAHVAQPQVVRPEVVAPLRDAVGLVDDEERRAAPRAGAPRVSALASCSGASRTNSRSPSWPGRRRPRRASRWRIVELRSLRAGAGRASPRPPRAGRCCSAMSGETTTVGPSRSEARELVDRRLAGAGRHDGERVATGERPPRPPRAARGAATRSRGAPAPARRGPASPPRTPPTL